MRTRHVTFALSFLLAACGDDETGTGGASTTSATASVTGSGNGSSSTGMAPANLPPLASFVATPNAGPAPLAVTFDASESSDPDGTITSFLWSLGGKVATGESVSETFDTPGCVAVDLTVTDDDGATGTMTAFVVVADGEPTGPAEVTVDVAPRSSAVIPRDVALDFGVARFEGTVTSPGFTEIVAELLDGDQVVSTVTSPICGDPATFALDVHVPSELKAFDVRLLARAGTEEGEEVFSVTDLVAGDIYVVQGQSNAVSSQYNGDASENESDYVRSFGANTADGAATAADVTWRPARGNAGGGAAAIGQWPSRMAGELSKKFETPIGLVNGADGGKPIGFFQRNDADVTDLATNYGRLLTRMRNAGIDGSIRGILWYQGESDGGDFQTHRDGFVALMEDWAEDYAGYEMLYVTQVRAGCGGMLIQTQEVQRKLRDDFPNLLVMSTTGLDAHDGCHYGYENGYKSLGERYVGLLGRDMYGDPDAPGLEPPDPMTAEMVDGGTQIAITLRDPMQTITFDDGAGADFRLEGSAATVVGGSFVDGKIVLELSGPAAGATGLTYLGHTGAGPWVLNENDIGLLEFYALPITIVANL